MEKGWAGRRLSNFLFVECYDYRKIENFDEMRRTSKESRQEQAKDWTLRHDRILPMTSFNALEFTPNCPPFSIFPFSDKRSRRPVDRRDDIYEFPKHLRS